MSSVNVAALVMDEFINGLGIIRSLAMDPSVRIFNLSTPDAATSKSRYVEKAFIYANQEELKKRLLEINALGIQIIPFPAKDANYELLIQMKTQLTNFFIPWSDLEILDKVDQSKRAEKFGITLPKTVFLEDHHALESIQTIPLPIMVKPAMAPKTGKTVFKALQASTHERARELAIQAIDNGQNAIVSHYIPGDDRSLYTLGGYAYEGELLIHMSGRKIAQKPKLRGTASLAEVLPDLDLSHLGIEFLKGINYTGLFQLEFKKSTLDQQYYFIEFNPRNWLWAHASTLSGPNLALQKFYTESKSGKQVSFVKRKKALFITPEGVAYNILKEKWFGIIPITLSAMIRNIRISFSIFKWSDLSPYFQFIKNYWLFKRGKRSDRR